VRAQLRHPQPTPQPGRRIPVPSEAEAAEGALQRAIDQPGLLDPAAVLGLQAAVGNRVVASLLATQAARPPETAHPPGKDRPGHQARPQRAGGRLSRLAQTIGSRVASGVHVQRCSKAQKAKIDALPEKTVTVDVTYLAGGSTSLGSHLAKANTVYSQAKVKVASGKEMTLNEADSKKILGEDLVLKEYDSPDSPTAEELELLKVNRTGGKITMYYVKALSQGSIGEAFFPGAGQVPGFVYASPTSRTWPHELGHVLLNDGGHPGDPKNFMAQTSTATGEEKMTAEQIQKVRGSPYVS